MAIELAVPKLGLTMEEAVLVSWSFQPGDQVAEEEIVLVLETDKVTFEMPAPGSGLLHPLVAPGETIKVSEVIGYLASDQAELDKLAADAPAQGGAAPASEDKAADKPAAEAPAAQRAQ